MSKIMIKCPVTGAEVATGIETDAATFDHLPNRPAEMICAACGGRHVWSRSEAWLAGFERTLPPTRRPLPAAGQEQEQQTDVTDNGRLRS